MDKVYRVKFNKKDNKEEFIDYITKLMVDYYWYYHKDNTAITANQSVREYLLEVLLIQLCLPHNEFGKLV